MSRRYTIPLLVCSFILAVAVFLAPPAHAQVVPGDPGNFITTWNTENPGTSANNQITIPGTGGGYNYDLYWEKVDDATATGSALAITTNSHTITFPEPGIYRVDIIGTFPRIYFNNGGDRQKILTVEQWGSNAWTSMERAFFGASNLRIPATDAPDLSGVTSMAYMFQGATLFNDSIDHWDVSNITQLGNTFVDASAFNQPLNSWDTSKVTTFFGTFMNASSFNQPLNNWVTSSSSVWINMFFGASSFNQPIDSWDMSSATVNNQMFYNATSFNQPLNSWDTSNITQMRRVFHGATNFNQPLDGWDVSKVGEFATSDRPSEGMFSDTSFDQDLSSWDIGSTTNMTAFFYNTRLSRSNQDATLTSWASQSVQSNVPFHLGLKTYGPEGAQAIATLKGLGWDITEQYQAQYSAGANITLSGTTLQKPLASGATTSAVTANPTHRCSFTRWSDGITDNPRVDTITDNLSVTALASCPPPPSTSATRQAQNLEEMGKHAEAAEIRRQFPGAFLPLSPTPGRTFERPEQRRTFMAILLAVFGLER